MAKKNYFATRTFKFYDRQGQLTQVNEGDIVDRKTFKDGDLEKNLNSKMICESEFNSLVEANEFNGLNELMQIVLSKITSSPNKDFLIESFKETVLSVFGVNAKKDVQIEAPVVLDTIPEDSDPVLTINDAKKKIKKSTTKEDTIS